VAALGASLGAFYRLSHFAQEVTRVRSGVPDLVFAGILGMADAEALQGYVVATQRTLRYPTASADVREGDTLITNVDGKQFRVLRHPELVADGNESMARLSQA
jgi:hypothetical protein